MEIKSYKKVSSTQYEIELSNKEKVKLYDEIILKYELLIDKKLNEKRFKEILDANSLIESYYKALNYISRRMRTKLEIKEYLKKCEYNTGLVEYAISRLQLEGYLNETRYVEAYLNDSLTLSLNGPKKIISNLQKLGIEPSLIEHFLSDISDEIWSERIKKIIEKKMKTNKNSSIIFKNKLYSDLINFGYSSELIHEMLNMYDFNDTEVFLKEADKVWTQLSRKYFDNELILRFKNKMYSKGFNSDDIKSYIEKKV